MKRMKLVMNSHETHGSNSDSDECANYSGGSSNNVIVGFNPTNPSRKYECENCHLEFPNKTLLDRHTLFCKTLADIRRGGGGGGGGGNGNGGLSKMSIQRNCSSDGDADPLMPTQREMFILIQELAMKYNKVKEELDVMKQWAKMVGRRIGSGGGGAGGAGGLDFTSITRQKRQNMEVILNEDDAEHPELAQLRPRFAEWLITSRILTETDLKVVFNEDLVAGITAVILRVLSEYTAESGKSHLVPFKLADIKQGAFYIYDTAFKVTATSPAEIASDPPTQVARQWRAMEPCEFQLMVRTFHKLLFKEFKKWQDRNWEAQQRMTSQRQMAASSFQQVMSSFQSSSLMIPCDGTLVGSESITNGYGCSGGEDEPVTPHVSSADPVLSEDFATLYNKYADKMMGGALSDETILSRVRVKLWKDMKVWRL